MIWPQPLEGVVSCLNPHKLMFQDMTDQIASPLQFLCSNSVRLKNCYHCRTETECFHGNKSVQEPETSSASRGQHGAAEDSTWRDFKPVICLQLRCAGSCCFLLCLLFEVRQDSVSVKHPQFRQCLLPQLRVKGHRDDGHLLQGEDDEVSFSQARHCQLTLDLCEVTVRLLETVDWRLEQRDKEWTAGTRKGPEREMGCGR